MTLQNLQNELTIRGFSPRTVEAYLHYNAEFLKYANKDEVSQDDVRAYLAHLINDRHFKPRSVNLAISALKFYHDEMMERNLFRKISALKPEQKQPELLTKAQLDSLFKASTQNPSHAVLIGLFCGSGPRVSENVQFTFEDLNERDGLTTIRKGKGAKERTVIFSKKVLELLRKIKEERKGDTNRFIFKSRSKRGHISRQQAWNIVKKYAKAAGITHRIYPHLLRASFATQLLEAGYDLGIIQELLGHESANTTRIYARYSKERIKKVKSPL